MGVAGVAAGLIALVVGVPLVISGGGDEEAAVVVPAAGPATDSGATEDAVPADDLPADDLPADDVPADDVPADDVPADEDVDGGVDLFSGPPRAASFLARVRALTATVSCPRSLGSGWPIDLASIGAPPADGTVIVTNGHVVEGCPRQVSVAVGDRTYRGEVTAVDYELGRLGGTDLALVVIEEQLETFPVARAWSVGQWVVASGSPVGIQGTVTFGNISNDRDGLIWTDALINEGNSGGPLINSAGEVVGINTWGLLKGEREDEERDTGIGIVQPVETLCRRLLDCRR